jgi:hypothetical protein
MPRGPEWTTDEANKAVRMHRAGHTFAEIGEELGRSTQAIKDAWRRNDRVLAELDSPEPRPRGMTTDDLAAKHGIDTNIYYPKKIRTTAGLHDWLRVEWELNVAEALVTGNFDKLVEELRHTSPRHQRRRRNPVFPELLITGIYVCDAHHGALSWAPETGFDWDLGISTIEHTAALSAGLDEATRRGVRRIVYRVGDDLFHYDKLIDGKAGGTFSGTVQDIDGRWQKMFNVVCAMLVDHVLMALEAGFDIDVIVVPGNHDTQTTYYAGKLLEARFFNDERVRFDTRPKVRKDYTWGRNLFIHTHGHEEKNLKDLRDLIWSEFFHLFPGKHFVEAHRGHLHHEDVHDERGLTIRTMRALTLNDNWHSSQGYSSIRGAQFLTYHKEEGIVGAEYYATSDQYHLQAKHRQGHGLEG